MLEKDRDLAAANLSTSSQTQNVVVKQVEFVTRRKLYALHW
jgi:hypothetical protein